MNYSSYSLSSHQIKKIINDKLNENPDIFYYVDDYFIQKVIDSIIDGVAVAVEENNKKLLDNIENLLEEKQNRRDRARGISKRYFGK
ncbi:hypothetical protein [Pseudalkalibacillus sp. JSM 102089]|uniref:hypothetical protein n=1 Tax=Pseudalkalibacillus sp. JSM 102089 TaxID=3229856 RepID=UPI003523DAD3